MSAVVSWVSLNRRRQRRREEGPEGGAKNRFRHAAVLTEDQPALPREAPPSPQAENPSVPIDAHRRLKELLVKDRALLRHLILLTQKARGGDPQLSSGESKSAMAAIGARLYDLDRDVAGRYVAVEFDPNPEQFVSLFDQIGEQTLSQFLELESVPDSNLDALPRPE